MSSYGEFGSQRPTGQNTAPCEDAVEVGGPSWDEITVARADGGVVDFGLSVLQKRLFAM